MCMCVYVCVSVCMHGYYICVMVSQSTPPTLLLRLLLPLCTWSQLGESQEEGQEEEGEKKCVDVKVRQRGEDNYGGRKKDGRSERY